MKSCDEMVNSLMKRREQYAAEKKRKRQMLTRMAASVCCICIVVLLGLIAHLNGWFDSVPEQTAYDALYPGVKDSFDEQNGESADNPAANNKIIVHQIDNLSSDANNICILVDDFVAMDKTELNEYYGINVFPTVPGDLKEWDDQKFGIYRRNGGTGEVYWDSTVINYSNEDFSKIVNVAVGKNFLPVSDYVLYNSTEEKSIINNIEIAIAQSKDGYYYAQFMYCGVGFQITANGITQDEFVAVISSLIE